jgi:hypothetical protein
VHLRFVFEKGYLLRMCEVSSYEGGTSRLLLSSGGREKLRQVYRKLSEVAGKKVAARGHECRSGNERGKSGGRVFHKAVCESGKDASTA